MRAGKGTRSTRLPAPSFRTLSVETRGLECSSARLAAVLIEQRNSSYALETPWLLSNEQRHTEGTCNSRLRRDVTIAE